ncbi:GNAT family N-acetyltransferase [Macellibacteroides fermentans]|uniref:GNAT family N-acetyltransferase n=1 Tax=Macellibacteroides fermentans TaxID=879969 RepID=UPI00406CAE34
MYQIKQFEFIPEDIIKTAIEMDHAVFQVSDWITEEEANMIYQNKKDCLIWLTFAGEPVGFVTVFPLNEDLPNKAMEKSIPIYKLLTQDALSDQDTDILYCHCFLLLPQYRERGLIYKLYDGLRVWLEEKGYNYSSLYADAVSVEGTRCLERLGFQPIFYFGEAGVLYKADKKSVIDVIRNM